MSGSLIPAATIEAYLAAEYRVRGDQPLILRIGEVSPGLLGLHQRHRVECSAFITACNPHSRILETGENIARQESLARELAALGLEFAEGIGCDHASRWPGEESFLVFGLALDEAMALGRRQQQNAIVWSGPDGLPQLILLR